MKLKVLSFNIHKGFNWNNTQLSIQHIKDAIHTTHADIVFLQEVVGSNSLHETNKEGWQQEQYKFIAEDKWSDFAYAKNAIYEHRHHGNAILSKYPIITSEQIDISTNQLEQRGVLFCEIQLPNMIVHAYCVHLNLLGKDRRIQYEKLLEIMYSKTDNKTPIILAGDFNDWNKQASAFFEEHHFVESFKYLHGSYPKTFPVQIPLLPLDRIYLKRLTPTSAKTLQKREWKKLSDHAALYVECELK
jgi:endonuclease/exonuclease/phosphatase family metal-dependent hydrolase